jgi:hypothetical protein
MNEATTSPTNRQIFKGALAGIIGSVIEQYDFLVTSVIAPTCLGQSLALSLRGEPLEPLESLATLTGHSRY